MTLLGGLLRNAGVRTMSRIAWCGRGEYGLSGASSLTVSMIRRAPCGSSRILITTASFHPLVRGPLRHPVQGRIRPVTRPPPLLQVLRDMRLHTRGTTDHTELRSRSDESEHRGCRTRLHGGAAIGRIRVWAWHCGVRSGKLDDSSEKCCGGDLCGTDEAFRRCRSTYRGVCAMTRISLLDLKFPSCKLYFLDRVLSASSNLKA